MRVSFSAFDLRDVMGVCKPLLETPKSANVKARPGLQFIELKCHWNHCLATGSNGYAVNLIRIRCKMEDEATPATLHILPFRIPAWADAVDMETDEKTGVTRFRIYNDKKTETVEQETPKVIPFNFERIEKLAVENISDERYVVLDRRLLVQALEGMKGCGEVVLHLGKSELNPILIQPYDRPQEDFAAESIVYPIRPSSWAGEVRRHDDRA